jgi:hypothetical protein
MQDKTHAAAWEGTAAKGIGKKKGRHPGLKAQMYVVCNKSKLVGLLNHLHNAETCFHCPQTFLYSEIQCRDDVSDLT